MRYLLILILFLLSLLALSCVNDENQKSTSGTQKKSTAVSLKDGNIPVHPFDSSVFQALVNENRGKVLFINAWATWCSPCKEEFPDLVKLADYYQDKNVTIIGISVDYPDEIDSKIRPFLKAQGVNFPNYVQNFDRPEDFINLLNEQWRGAVPASFIYDENGQQKAFLLGKHTLEEFKSAIEKILQKE
jgi:thiol-disulfide isomerase/thioredoxin